VSRLIGKYPTTGDHVTARLTFIAHAATEAQRQAAFPLDEPVVEREIAKIATLNWTAPRANRVQSGPELRTRQTSHALKLNAAISDELRDCDYGAWNGLTMDEVQLENPDGMVAWLTDPAAAPHGGESIASLIKRTGSWLEEQRDVAHIIAVTHPAVIRGAIVHALQLPLMTFWRFDVAPLSLTDLRFNGRVWSVRCVGCPL
jgi:broad specificity phosphatase PhoE